VKKVDRDIPVLIKADETTQLKKLAFVMDACRKTGLNKFSLQSR
jgi:biopolymer transport protein ExbD